MKSLLQDGDICVTQDGEERTVQGSDLVLEMVFLLLELYNEDLSRIDHCYNYDIIRVIRNGEIIWQQTQPINKMMTFELNGVEHPVANHENMKILVDQVSELEAKVMELQTKLNEILK